MSTRRRSVPRAAPGALLTACGSLALLVSACSFSDDGAHPAVPSPSGRAAAACRALHDALPQKVDGQRRGTAEPESDYTAVWGDPAIALRCGVPAPEKLRPGSAEYDPVAEAAEVNGVSWLLEKHDGGYRFTTTGRVAYVEVEVPDHYAPEVNALTDLAEAVDGAVPEKNPE
ncbi:DUF3515 domain-containing protein [Streptomyces cacaoi]|uniref:DUF3515 domain-containing protein n=1 Tax=Streptomyces cacaoi TaxID=1898 RepID=UPI00331F1D5F